MEEPVKKQTRKRSTHQLAQQQASTVQEKKHRVRKTEGEGSSLSGSSSTNVSTPTSIRFDEATWEFHRRVSEETGERVQDLLRESLDIGMLFLPLKGRINTRNTSIGTLSRAQWIQRLEPWTLLAIHVLSGDGINLLKLPEQQLVELSVHIMQALQQTRNVREYYPNMMASPTSGGTGPIQGDFPAGAFDTDEAMDMMLGSGGFEEITQEGKEVK